MKVKIDSQEKLRMINELNACLNFVIEYGWLEGYRNDLTVNIAISCEVLEVSAIDLVKKAMKINGHCHSFDLTDFKDRYLTIKEYLPLWKYDFTYYLIDDSFLDEEPDTKQVLVEAK